jgi:hypothetical protein
MGFEERRRMYVQDLSQIDKPLEQDSAPTVLQFDELVSGDARFQRQRFLRKALV